MIRALLYLQMMTAWNRFRARLQRLKQPKYLAGFLVGGLYFFFYLIRPLFLAGPGWSGAAAAPPAANWAAGLAGMLEVLAATILAVVVLGAWIFPQGRAALSFTEAEAAFLFPAPVRRRTLIHFKLLRSQASILVSTLIMALVSSRFGRHGHGWAHVAGWWLVLSTLNLHFLGASFARTRLLDWGINHWTRRWILLGLLLAAGLGAWWWIRLQFPQALAEHPPPHDLDGWLREIDRLLNAPPLSLLLAPFRWLIRPGLASSPADFLRTIGPALLLLAGHYVWVIRSDVAFEEASLEQARQRADRLATLHRHPSQPPPSRARRPPFHLHSTGPAAIALLWKNLILASTLLSGRLWIVLGLSFGIPAVVIGVNARQGEISLIAAMLLAMGLAWSVLLGPQLLRQDLRQDLRSADVLKLYPLPGWKIILGELLAPTLILSLVQWFLIGLLILVFTGAPGGQAIPISQRLSVATGAALLCPGINLLSLLVPNAAVLLFPAWLQTGPGGPQGIEATGQRLISLLGQLLVFSLALAPAAAAAVGVQVLLTLWLPWMWSVPAAAAAAVLLLLLESAAGIALLGQLFERLDVATELRA